MRLPATPTSFLSFINMKQIAINPAGSLVNTKMYRIITLVLCLLPGGVAQPAAPISGGRI
jgi:hypothetical protein